MRFLVIFFYVMGLNLYAQDTGVDLTITVSNIKEKKGLIRIGVFKTEDDYKKKINQIRKGSYPAVDDTLTVTYNQVTAGYYAIILFHDINENDRNDSNAIGIPQEPFGLSNNIVPGVGLPAFSKTRFEVKDKAVSVEVKLQSYQKKWSVGGAVLTSFSPYVDSKPKYYPIPIIAYQGDRIEVLGIQASYSIWRNEKMNFSLGLKLNFDGYNSDDSDAFEGMEDRELSLDGSFKWQYNFVKKWNLKTDVYYDLLGVSDGFHGSLSVGRSFDSEKFMLIPSVGVKWEDENYVDYYYGVSSEDETSSREEYHPGFTFNPYVECTYLRFWGQSWATYLTVSAIYLDEEIQNSPLVDQKFKFSFLMALVYRF